MRRMVPLAVVALMAIPLPAAPQVISAEIYAGLYAEESREGTYLRSYHRFYGEEDALYTTQFRAAVGGPGQRRAHLTPYVSSNAATTFLGRMRLADIALKGSPFLIHEMR